MGLGSHVLHYCEKERNMAGHPAGKLLSQEFSTRETPGHLVRSERKCRAFEGDVMRARGH